MVIESNGDFPGDVKDIFHNNYHIKGQECLHRSTLYKKLLSMLTLVKLNINGNKTLKKMC